jgi:hypothetical protein
MPRYIEIDYNPWDGKEAERVDQLNAYERWHSMTPGPSGDSTVPVNHDPFADTAGANAAWVRPGEHTYNTPLQPADETAFRNWTQQNKVLFNPDAGVTDYDMRGYWQGLQTGDPRARSGVDPDDQRLHYPDVWKTPYHQTFSRESQWATPQAPQWTPQRTLVDQFGNTLFSPPQAIPTPY